MRYLGKRKCDFVLQGVLLLVVAVIPQVLRAEREYKTVRFMTYNVRHCSGMDNVVNIKRTAGVISAQEPDVCAIQELDSMVSRSGKTYQINGLARFSGLKYAYFAKAIPLSGGAYGVGIISKTPALSVKKIPLPGTEARVLLIVEFEDYVYACTHFDLDDNERMNSVELVKQEIKGWRKPFIIAGDWNDTPTSKFITELKKDLTLFNTAFTFPANNPTSCIDYIATYTKRYPAECVKSWVPANDVESDHRPLVADLKIPIPTGVGDVTENRVKVSVRGNTLSFSGTTEQDVVSVYTLDAVKVVERVAPQDIKLLPGAYVVKINDETTKILVGK